MLSKESRLRYSEASKRRQSLVPPEIRKARMVVAAKKRWEGVSPEGRREHALKMVQARLKNVTDNKGSEGSNCECARDGEVR